MLWSMKIETEWFLTHITWKMPIRRFDTIQKASNFINMSRKFEKKPLVAGVRTYRR